MEKEKRITPRQRKAIEALLSQPNVTAAAAAAGLNKGTIYHWMKHNPVFRDALNEATSQSLNYLSLALVGLAQESVKALQEIITDPNTNAGNRLKAAEINLTNLLRIAELVSVDSRINELEVTIKQQGNEYAG